MRSGRLGVCSVWVPRMESSWVTLSRGAKLGRTKITLGTRQMNSFPRGLIAYVRP
jgi:hypothetical protein